MISDTAALDQVVAKMRETGHQVFKSMLGNEHGLRCARCTQFHNHSEFRKWSKPCKPKQSAKAMVEQQASQKLKHNLKVQELMAIKRLEEDLDAGTPPTKSRRTEDNRILAPAQADDKTEAEELNSDFPPAREKPAGTLTVK